ncbi:LysR family transcriptional regulator [Seongchinamella sediminis]|uniref:LysR family transcriptional regulator n=2 Tax=Seongchinamella sediminis TaxID=2283635 RepID=A0A3L7DW57_9GAMM|nr:LysR family transcriptional regulator [Seongchinamella sediminis]
MTIIGKIGFLFFLYEIIGYPMQDAQNLMIFAQVLESGSFSKAAQRLGIANSSVSKRMQVLEASLGVRLIHRTTRSLKPTEEGQKLYERCARIKEQIEDISLEASGFKEIPRGSVKICVPPLMAHTKLTPQLPDFLSRYPEVSIELELTERESDLQHTGFDLSIRTGELRDSSVIAQQLCIVNSVLCAAPGYLDQHGRPSHPTDLEKYNYLAWRSPDRKSYNQLVFRKGTKSYKTPTAGNFVSSNALAVKEAAIFGAGITLLPDITINQEIESGLLEQLLPRYTCYQYPLYMCYHHRDHLPAKMKVATEFIKKVFQSGS